MGRQRPRLPIRPTLALACLIRHMTAVTLGELLRSTGGRRWPLQPGHRRRQAGSPRLRARRVARRPAGRLPSGRDVALADTRSRGDRSRTSSSRSKTPQAPPPTAGTPEADGWTRTPDPIITSASRVSPRYRASVHRHLAGAKRHRGREATTGGTPNGRHARARATGRAGNGLPCPTRDAGRSQGAARPRTRRPRHATGAPADRLRRSRKTSGLAGRRSGTSCWSCPLGPGASLPPGPRRVSRLRSRGRS